MIGKTFAQCTTVASLTRDLFVVLITNSVFGCPVVTTPIWRLLTYSYILHYILHILGVWVLFNPILLLNTINYPWPGLPPIRCNSNESLDRRVMTIMTAQEMVHCMEPSLSDTT